MGWVLRWLNCARVFGLVQSSCVLRNTTMPTPSDSSAVNQPGSTADSGSTVHAVARALAVLDAFDVDEQTVSLSELSRRLSMGKSTVLRTARTLAAAGYLAQTQDGRWRLGPAAGWL